MYILHQKLANLFTNRRPVGDYMTRLYIQRQLATAFDDNGLPATDTLATAAIMSLGDQPIRVAHTIRGLSKLCYCF